MNYVSTNVSGAVATFHLLSETEFLSALFTYNLATIERGREEKRVLLWHGQPYTRFSVLMRVLWYTSILFLLHIYFGTSTLYLYY